MNSFIIIIIFLTSYVYNIDNNVASINGREWLIITPLTYNSAVQYSTIGRLV